MMSQAAFCGREVGSLQLATPPMQYTCKSLLQSTANSCYLNGIGAFGTSEPVATVHSRFQSDISLKFSSTLPPKRNTLLICVATAICMEWRNLTSLLISSLTTGCRFDHVTFSQSNVHSLPSSHAGVSPTSYEKSLSIAQQPSLTYRKYEGMILSQNYREMPCKVISFRSGKNSNTTVRARELCSEYQFDCIY